MAMNWPTFFTRLGSAVVFCAIMLVGLLWNEWSFLALISLITILCLREYFGLLKKILLQYHKQTGLYGLLALPYIVLPMGLLYFTYRMDDLLPLMIILMIWCNDTLAYLVGSFIGKTPLSKISPKKTWEGTLGGIILTVVAVYVWSCFKETDFSAAFWMGLALVVSVTGTFGDLMESKLKRMADVKDSGAIMPGHGGALDRFDSLLIAAPFAFAYVYVFMM